MCSSSSLSSSSLFVIREVIFTSLMTNNVEYLFTWLFSIHKSSLKCLFRSLSIFLISWLFSYCWALKLCYIIRIYVLYQIRDLQTFSPRYNLAFHCLNSIFCRAKVFNFGKVQFINFIFHRLWKDHLQEGSEFL